MNIYLDSRTRALAEGCWADKYRTPGFACGVPVPSSLDHPEHIGLCPKHRSKFVSYGADESETA